MTGNNGQDAANKTFDQALDKSGELRVSKVGDKKDGGESAANNNAEPADARGRGSNGPQDSNLTSIKSGHISQTKQSTQKELT